MLPQRPSSTVPLLLEPPRLSMATRHSPAFVKKRKLRLKKNEIVTFVHAPCSWGRWGGGKMLVGGGGGWSFFLYRHCHFLIVESRHALLKLGWDRKTQCLKRGSEPKMIFIFGLFAFFHCPISLGHVGRADEWIGVGCDVIVFCDGVVKRLLLM